MTEAQENITSQEQPQQPTEDLSQHYDISEPKAITQSADNLTSPSGLPEGQERAE